MITAFPRHLLGDKGRTNEWERFDSVSGVSHSELLLLTNIPRDYILYLFSFHSSFHFLLHIITKPQYVSGTGIIISILEVYDLRSTAMQPGEVVGPG